MKETFKVAPHIAWRRVENEIVALDLNTSVYYSFNETGARIWELLAESSPLDEAVRKVLDEFDVDAKDLEKDVTDFVAELRKEQLLEPA